MLQYKKHSPQILAALEIEAVSQGLHSILWECSIVSFISHSTFPANVSCQCSKREHCCKTSFMRFYIREICEEYITSVARRTVRVLSPILIPLRPLHATSVTVPSPYTTNPYLQHGSKWPSDWLRSAEEEERGLKRRSLHSLW